MKDYQDETKKIAIRDKRVREVDEAYTLFKKQNRQKLKEEQQEFAVPVERERQKAGGKSASSSSSSSSAAKGTPKKSAPASAAAEPLKDECRLEFIFRDCHLKEGNDALEEILASSMAQVLKDALKNEDYIGPRLCGFCQKEGFDFPVCSKCKVIAYCSPKCQKDNERTHARECQSTVCLLYTSPSPRD